MPLGTAVARRGTVYDLLEPEKLIVKKHGLVCTRFYHGVMRKVKSGVLVEDPSRRCHIIDASRLIAHADAVVAWRDHRALVDDKIRKL